MPTMEEPTPASPTANKPLKFEKPTFKPGVLSYGCDHVRRSMVGPKSIFVTNYRNALHTICDHSPVMSQHYTDGKGRIVARISPLYLCLQCNNTVPMELLDEHVKDTKHRICLFVDSRSGHVYCDMCKDYVFDQTLERFRTKKVESGSSAYNPRKRKHNDEHAELFQANTIKEASKEASKQSCNTTTLKGMWNMGSTCYMTSILECLVHNPLIRNFYLSEGHKSSTCPKTLNNERCLSCNMDDMFQQFNNTESTNAFAAQNTYASFLASSKVVGTTIKPNAQQDAHEFFNLLLDELHEISSSDPRSIQAETSPIKRRKFDEDNCSCVIHQTFYGKTLNIIKCKGEINGKKCGRITRSSPQQFAELSLGLNFHDDLSKKRSAPTTYSLESILKKEYFSEEQCDYNCAECGNKKAAKQVSIKTLPNVLCIQLKRFTQKQSGDARKLVEKVSFPLKLEMLPYTDKSNEGVGYGKVQHALRSRSIYHLQSVLCHVGDKIDEGHYISFSKHENQWFKFDDHKVYLASKSEVLGAEAYILFYVIQSLASGEEKKA